MVLTNSLLTAARNDTVAFLGADMTHMAIGTGTTAPTSADTALTTEVFDDVIDEIDTSQVDRRSFTLQVGSGEANGNTIAEIGAKNGTTLRVHDLINSIAKDSSLQLFVTVTITVTCVEI